MDSSARSFFERTYGNYYNVDHAYGYQCWDLFAKFCVDNGVPLTCIYCALTGFVQDIWQLRNESGILKYFDAVKPENIITGDWVIWGSDYNLTPKSHVAMAYDGQAFGQSQSGIKCANLVSYLDFKKALGAFRFKGWNMLQIGSGAVLYDQYAGQEIQIRGFADGRKITLISAKTDGVVHGNDVQLITDIDDSEHIYYSKLNANRWIMSTGQALGVRVGVNEHSVPRQGAFYYYAVLNDGTTEIGIDYDYWYPSDQVQFACSPDVILMHNGIDKMLYSPEVVGTKENANVQSLLIRTADRFATALVKGRLTPAQCLAWAKSISGVQDVIMMDSGGSSCQQIGTSVTYATKEHRKISNAIAEYEDKPAVLPLTETATDDGFSVSESETETDEQIPAADLKPAVIALNGGGNGQNNLTRTAEQKEGYYIMLSDKMYTFLKWLCLICLPAVAFFLMQYGTYFGIEQPEIIGKIINGIATLLGTLIGVSTASYYSKEGETK